MEIFKSINQIFLRTNKGEYVGGETIYGTIYLSLLTPLPAKSLELRVKGFEKVRWEYEHFETVSDGQGGQRTVREIRHRQGKREFFKSKIVLFEFPLVGGLPNGYYSYPFQFQLPNELPGVFEKHKKKHEGWRFDAQVRYKIKAVLDIPFTKHDLKVTQPLIIHERLDRAVQPQHYTKNGTVRLLCCIPRGEVNVEAWMDKNAYMSGETAQIHVRVQNNSKSNIDNFAVKLMRVISLQDNEGHTKSLISTVCVAKYEGCLSGASKESDVPLTLVSMKGARKPLQPATRSTLIKCQYHVDIEMQIPWAPDVEIHAPVVLYSPANLYWAQWQPPPWAAQCVQQQVAATVAVAPDILRAQFAGMPGY